METIFFDNEIFNFRGIDYEVMDINSEPGMSVLVRLMNREYYFTIALVANETTINGVLQTSSEMIVDTLTS